MVTTSDELGDLTRKFNEIAESTGNMFRKWIKSVQETNKAKEREEFLREIALKSITTLQTNQVLKSVVNQAGKDLTQQDAILLDIMMK